MDSEGLIKSTPTSQMQKIRINFVKKMNDDKNSYQADISSTESSLSNSLTPQNQRNKSVKNSFLERDSSTHSPKDSSASTTQYNNPKKKAIGLSRFSQFHVATENNIPKTNQIISKQPSLSVQSRLNKILSTKFASEQEAQTPQLQSQSQSQQTLNKKTQKPFFIKKIQIQVHHTVSDVEPNLIKSANNAQNQLDTHPFRYLIHQPNIEFKTFQKYLLLLQKGLLYSTKCLKSPSDNFINSKKVYFIPEIPTKHKTLLLDLDETLIHACLNGEPCDTILHVFNQNQEKVKIPVIVRPYVKEFIKRLSEYYEIAVYTASAEYYAEAIVKLIDPEQKIKNILTRENCMQTKNGFFIKDLRIIGNRSIQNMIIIDNLAHSFGFHIENGIPILEFINDLKDRELMYMVDYLIQLSASNDIRETNRKNLQLHKLAQISWNELLD